jgi:hypothetical protein
MNFKTYNPTQNLESDGSIYADVVNHCKNFRSYLVGDETPSSVHEITHCINSDLRNGMIGMSPAHFISGIDYSIGGPNDPIKYPVMQCRCGSPLAKSAGRINTFYVLENRYVQFDELTSRKKDCIAFIPKSLRADRYDVYVNGQEAWDDCPLYIFDEWVAYLNGAACVLEMYKKLNLKYRSYDFLFGPIEFITYGVATLMAAPSITPELGQFAVWMIQETIRIYSEGKQYAPWKQADDTYQILAYGIDAADIRAFLRTKFNYSFLANPFDWSM